MLMTMTINRVASAARDERSAARSDTTAVMRNAGKRSRPRRQARAALARGQDHDHLAAFHARLVFDLGHRIEVGPDLLQQLHAEFGMAHFAAAEAQGDLHLVALLEVAVHGAGFDVVVVRVDVGAQPDLLDLDQLLPLARGALLLLLFELVLAVVEDLADRRVGVRRHLDQVEPRLLGGLQCGGGGHDALFFTLLIDQEHAGDTDIFIDARAVLGRGRWHGTTNRQALLEPFLLRAKQANLTLRQTYDQGRRRDQGAVR